MRRDSKPSSSVKEPTAAVLVSSMRCSSAPTPCRRFTQAYGKSTQPAQRVSGYTHKWSVTVLVCQQYSASVYPLIPAIVMLPGRH